MKTKSPIAISRLLVGWLITASVAPAAVITWTNTSGGFWSTANNWSPNTLPAAADDVAITNAGIYTVTLDVHSTVASLSLGGSSGTQTLTNPGYSLSLNGASSVNAAGVLSCAGGTLTGAGMLTIRGNAVWTGGTISGALTVATNGVLNIGGSATKDLNGTGILINHGLVAWAGLNDIQTANSARIINQPGALFDIQNNQSLSMYNGGAITNLGILRKSAGGGTTTITVPLYNSGTLDVQSGVIAYGGAGSQFNDGTAFTGTGTNLVYTGTITFNGAISSANLEIRGATIAGNGIFSGVVNWTSGTLGSGVMTVANNGVLNIKGSQTVDLNGTGTLINYGSVVWSGTNDIQTANSARIINQPGALFDIQNNQLFSIYNGGAITNLGTLRKSAGGGITIITVPLFNFGTLDVQSGMVAYGNGSQFNDGTAFTGAGTNLVYYGTITFNGSILSENLELGGATFGGSGVFSGVVRWTSGDLSSGAFTVATNGTLHIGGSAAKHLNGTGALINYGAVIWSGTNDIETSNSARIINQPGALFDIQNNQVFSIYNGGVITNLGTIRKSAGGGTSIITVPLYNFGTLNVQSGAIGYGATVGSHFNDGTAFTGTGTNLVYLGTVTFDGAIASENLEIGGANIGGNSVFSGAVNWTSGNIPDKSVFTVATNGVLRISGSVMKYLTGTGTLINYGCIIWSGSNDIQTFNYARIINQPGALFDIQNNQLLDIWNGGAITNLGTLRKSAGGGTTTITVPLYNSGTVDVQGGTIAFGNYTQTGGKLSFGLNSFTNFGRLTFANSIAFNGTLGANLNGGYTPVAGDAFALITYPSRTGTFTDFDLPATHAWQTNISIYGATAVTLTVLNARPTLDPISELKGNEETAITFTATATDPDPAQTRSFSLLGAPPEAIINPDTGVFSWTPSEAQGPSTYQFAVQVSDNGSPPMTHTQNVTVAVNEVNRVPVTTPLALAPINELLPFVLATNLATDPDLPANGLSFALLSPPPGALIDAATGVFTWTPTERQGPSTNAISVQITDSGSPPLRATNTFTLVVNEVNTAPTLAPISNRTHVTGAICWITNSASDLDLPTNQLSFSLVNPPPGMNIGPMSGVIVWGPPANCSPLTNTVTVRVTDNGSPPMTNEQTFVTTLILPPRLRIASAGLDLVVLSWPAAATDAGFELQSNSNLLASASWEQVVGAPVVSAGENFLTNGSTAGFHAYRLAAALMPLPMLEISPANSNGVVLSWPASATALGFAPQAAPNLDSPVSWSNATNVIGTNGSQFFLTDPLAGPQRYFRLRLPARP